MLDDGADVLATARYTAMLLIHESASMHSVKQAGETKARKLQTGKVLQQLHPEGLKADRYFGVRAT
jgi:hypothetical protein